MAYKLRYSDYPGTDTGPPDPERWVGPPGPAGPTGPAGPIGPPGADGTGAVHSVAGKAGDVILIHTDITDWTAATATLGAVQSVAGKTGAVTLVHDDITDWASATSILVPSSGNIIAGLGYTPYDAANPANYQTNVQVSATVTASVANYVPLGQRAAANGVATLDATGVVPTLQLPGAVTGTLSYKGGWNAATNTPVMASGALAGGVLQTAGSYYLVTVGATTAAIDGITTWVAGDWISSNGTVWQRVQNSTSPYLPIAGGTVGPGALNSALVNFASADLTKALTITPQDDLPADIRFVDDFGNAGIIIYPDGSLDATLANVTLQNTIIYEVADGSNAIQVQDELGFVAFVIDANGIVETQTLLVDTVTANMVTTPTGSGPLNGSALMLTHFTITELSDGLNDVWFCDEFGYVAFGIVGIDGSLVGGGSGGSGGGGGGDDPNSFSPSLITARDALATALSMAVQDQTDSKVAKPIWRYNHIVSYGQSLAIGSQGTPRLSTNEGLDNLCLGTMPASNTGAGATTFVPFGDGSFHTLDNTQGNEVPAISTTNQWRKLYLRQRNLTTDLTKQFVINSCGAGGMAIEELSKGASPNLYNQVPDLITQAKAAAVAAGGTYGVVVIYYVQGDSNYFKAGFDHTESGYLAKFNQLKADLIADVKAITGQIDPPLFLTVQAGTSFGSTIDDCAIGNAQITAGTNHTGCYLASPYYMTPNVAQVTNEHMTNDGYRWVGNKCGHLLHKLLDLDEGWAPTMLTNASFRGSQVLLACHTPQPPLQSQPCYLDATTTTTFPDLGFRAGDDSGALNINAVALYNSVILLTLDRTVNATAHPWVQYGDFTIHGGNANVCDSDPFSALDTFTTTGLPYPGFNWLQGARLNIVADT